MVDPICDFVSAYCSLDNYSSQTAHGFYRVNNLYLDSPNYLFLKKRMDGAENRFNMRIRSYGDKPSLPYFLEIKQKIGTIIRKYRALVSNKNFHKAFTEPGFTLREPDDSLAVGANKDRFERLIYSYRVSPKLLTQYLRKAWVSDVDDYARVTFDRDLRYMPESNYNLMPREEEMVSYDPETLFDPGCSVVLELKCYTLNVPLWMIDLIKYFDLTRRSFSKYMSGALEVLGHHRYDTATRVSTF